MRSNKLKCPPDGYLTNAWPSIFGPREFIRIEEMSAFSRRQMEWYDNLPRRERDKVKELGK